MEDLTGIGKFAPVANNLIEKVSDAIGGSLKPWQIKRVAEANAEAKCIETQAECDAIVQKARAEAFAKCEQERIRKEFNQSFQIDKTIAEPAIRRMVCEEVKKQFNMESILSQAIPLLKETATPEAMDEDWIMDFFNKARNISNEDMQRTWAKLLAEEANSPNSIRKKSLFVLSNMSHSDAKIFEKLASLSIETIGTPIFFEFVLKKEFGWNYFNKMQNLCELGLLHFSSLDFLRTFDKPNITLKYGNKKCSCILKQKYELKFGRFCYTQAGFDLWKVANRNDVSGLLDTIISEKEFIECFEKIGPILIGTNAIK